jgi:hypothetical protein
LPSTILKQRQLSGVLVTAGLKKNLKDENSLLTIITIKSLGYLLSMNSFFTGTENVLDIIVSHVNEITTKKCGKGIDQIN